MKCKHEIQITNGISAAFNLALTKANGEWINFLNGGDAYAHENVITTIKKKLHENLDILAGRSRDIRAGNLIPRNIYFHSRRIDQISHQASLYRRTLFDRHGDFSTEFSVRMDFEWMLRLPVTTSIDWIDAVLINFEGGGASSISPIRSCSEELRALKINNKPLIKSAKLIGIYLPFRLARGWIRKLYTPK